MKKDLADKLTYDRYLKIDELLQLQQQLSDPKQHDEMLFIIIHQAYELWFRQTIHELEKLLELITDGKISAAYKTVDRIVQIQKVLVAQIDVLNTLSPDEFATFRENLNPASGFQSHQFRVVEYLCGIKDEQYLTYHKHNPDAFNKLTDYLNRPSLYDVLLQYLDSQKFAVPKEVLERDVSKTHEPNEAIVDCFFKIYSEKENYSHLYYLCERLIEMDDNFQLWRFRHVKMVERTIGQKMGTGGSLGAKYLRTTLDKCFFPELWSVRSRIGTY